MKVIIETYRLLRKMGLFRAYSTHDIVSMKSHQRCSVLKQLHRLEKAGYIEKKTGSDNEFYWIVKEIPDKPKAMELWKESTAKAVADVEEALAHKY